MNDFLYVKNNYMTLRESIERTADRVGVKPPMLLPVTKSGTDEELIALFSYGATALGENRPSELKRRAELLAEHGFSPELHEIGTLQSNKAKLISKNVSLVHSLASLSLAKELNRQAAIHGRTIPVLIEINSAEEMQKDGVMPSDARAFLEEILGFEGLDVRGLMTMGPVCEVKEDIRKYFRLTKELFDALNSEYGFGGDPVLSMGMTDSYEIAIEEGSTLLRIGRRLFEK